MIKQKALKTPGERGENRPTAGAETAEKRENAGNVCNDSLENKTCNMWNFLALEGNDGQ